MGDESHGGDFEDSAISEEVQVRRLCRMNLGGYSVLPELVWCFGMSGFGVWELASANEVGFNLLLDRTGRLLRSRSAVSRRDVLNNPRVPRINSNIPRCLSGCLLTIWYAGHKFR